jgi:hypothetical protein
MCWLERKEEEEEGLSCVCWLDRNAIDPPKSNHQVIGVQECMVMDGLKEAILDFVGRDDYMWCVVLFVVCQGAGSGLVLGGGF